MTRGPGGRSHRDGRTALHNDVDAGRRERTKTARAPQARVIAATRTPANVLYRHVHAHNALSIYSHPKCVTMYVCVGSHCTVLIIRIYFII